MMGAFAQYYLIATFWFIVALALSYVSALLAGVWVALGFALLIAHAAHLAIKLRRLVKEHPELRWRLV